MSHFPLRLAVAALATARLTRFVTTDDLGWWTIRKPLETAALKHEHRIVAQTWLMQDSHTSVRPEEDPSGDGLVTYFGPALSDEDLAREVKPDGEPLTWQAKAVTGLACPFCVGQWIAFGVLGSLLVLEAMPANSKSKGRLEKAWTFLMGGLALNYVTGHVSKRLDG